MRLFLIALLATVLTLPIVGCSASQEKKLVTEIQTVKVTPPASLMQCPKPKVEPCGKNQDCIAGNLVSVSGAWAECRGNALALQKWSSGVP